MTVGSGIDSTEESCGNDLADLRSRREDSGQRSQNLQDTASYRANLNAATVPATQQLSGLGRSVCNESIKHTTTS